MYVADQRADDVYELFSVPVDGSADPVVLNGPLPEHTEGDVFAFAPEFDEQGVVYVADQDLDDAMDLYRVARDGRSAPVRLTAALAERGDVTDVVVGSTTNHVVFGYDLPRAAEPSRLYAGRTEPVEGRLLDATDAQILAPFVLTPDGSRVLYRQGISLDECDLFSCAMDGSTAPIQLGEFFEVSSFQLTPSSDTVVFTARPTDSLSRNSLYVAPIDGSREPIELDPSVALRDQSTPFAITPDGSRAVFIGHNLRQLFSVRIDGSTPAVSLSPTPRAVLDFAIASDGRVVYREDPSPFDNAADLLVVPAAGGSPPLRLTQNRRVDPDYVLSADGRYVFYRSRRMSESPYELFVVRTDGTWSQPLRLSGPLAPGGNVLSFQVTPDQRGVVYLADQRTDDAFELFRHSLGRPLAPVDDLPAFADVSTYRVDARSRRVLYLADRDEDGREELFAAALDGSAPPERVNGPLVEGGSVRADFVPLADGGVLYVADQELDETFELFHLPAPPPHRPAEEPSRSATVVR